MSVVERRREDIERSLPGFSPAIVTFLLSVDLIRDALGDRWSRKNLQAELEAVLLADRGSGTEVDGRYLRYQLVTDLARRLFEFEDEQWYPRLVENLRNRGLTSAAFEADVLRVLMAAPLRIRLRKETGTLGSDYDIDVDLGEMGTWAIEAKAKEESTPYSVENLVRCLKKARRQLPPGGVGAIFLKVPPSWTNDPDYQRSHPGVIRDQLRQTSRVHLVVVGADIWTSSPSGRGFRCRREWSPFLRKDPAEVVTKILPMLEEAWRLHWDIGPTAPF
jgi:hypothetical protein